MRKLDDEPVLAYSVFMHHTRDHHLSAVVLLRWSLLLTGILRLCLLPVHAADFSAEVPFQKGRYFLEWNQLDRAIIELEKALEIDHEHSRTRTLLARSYALKSRETANPVTRLELLLKARELGGGDEAERALAADLSETYLAVANVEQDQLRKSEFLESALRLASAGRVEAVLGAMRETADATGSYDRLLGHLDRYYQTGPTTRTRRLLTETAMAAAENAVSIYKTIRFLTTAVKTDPGNREAREMLALAHVKLARTIPDAKNRIIILKQALRYHPDCSEAKKKLFQTYLSVADNTLEPGTRGTWYQKALKLEPGNKTAEDGLVMANIELVSVMQDDENRIKLLLETIDIKPVVEAYYLLAEIYGERGDHLGQIKILRLALKHDPKFYKAKVAIADTYFNLALRAYLLSETIQWYHLALSFHPHNIQSLHNYGLLLEKKGLINEAIITFREAVSFDSHFAPGYYHLGRLYWKEKGDHGKAVENFNYYRLLDPDSPTSRKVKKWLQQLERERRLQ